MDKSDKDKRIQELEQAIRMIHFQLSTMPPFPGWNQMPFGISYSLKLIKDVLPNPSILGAITHPQS